MKTVLNDVPADFSPPCIQLLTCGRVGLRSSRKLNCSAFIILVFLLSAVELLSFWAWCFIITRNVFLIITSLFFWIRLHSERVFQSACALNTQYLCQPSGLLKFVNFNHVLNGGIRSIGVSTFPRCIIAGGTRKNKSWLFRSFQQRKLALDLTLRKCISGMSGSKFGEATDYSDWGFWKFSSYSSGKLRYSTLI
jgi:hypothetical protein